MAFFIPWRVVADESGAAHFDLLGPPGRAGADFHFSDIPVRGDDGARAIGANDDAAAVELRGRRRRHPGSKAALTIESRVDWSLGEWSPTNPARRISTCSGRLGAPAPIFILVIFRFGATMELGRSERTTMRPLWSYGVDGADTPDRKPR
jgi:hypothetical protein